MPLKEEKDLPEIKRVKTDHSNLGLTKDQFIEKYRKEKELETRLAIASEKIRKELEEEGEEYEKFDPDGVETVKSKRGRKQKSENTPVEEEI